ncbi:MAG: YSC84-related protein [Rhodospirillales bacterium]|jgi:lipid-binding SYLF domain-containing protein|nr:YSC84-related protein [Rhodospirillales bacterium]
MKRQVMTALAGGAIALAVSATTVSAAQTAAELTAAVQQTIASCYQTVETCNEFGNKASGMLVFPEVTKAAVGIGGEYGEGALVIGGKPAGFYSATAASIGLQLGAERRSQIIMFMTDEALKKFQASDGWEIGGKAGVTVIDTGMSGKIDTKSFNDPVVGYIFGEKGLMADLSFEGQKISKIQR